MKIVVSGTGYVGLIQGVGLAKLGHDVVCVDIDKHKVEQINRGEPPIYEKQLDKLLKEVVGSRLTATTDLKSSVMEADVIFVCVGTPSRRHGEIKLNQVKEVSESIGQVLTRRKPYPIVVVKSTVIPSTCESVVIPAIESSSGKKFGVDFGVAMNPEFLREGSALDDFFNPDRIVIGSSDKKTISILEQLYSAFKCPIMVTDFGEAEMIKYASNALLATKISFINEVGNICKKLGINTNKVAEGVGLDHRLSPHFLKSGIGFGGSCFPKDVSALVHKATELGYYPRLLKSVLDVNRDQPHKLLGILENHEIKDRRIAILGLTFKAHTDDVRESPSLSTIKELLTEQTHLYLYDPMGMPTVKRLFPHLHYTESAQAAVDKSEIVLILTEWPEFAELDYADKPVIDGKNLFDGNRPKNYQGICW